MLRRVLAILVLFATIIPAFGQKADIKTSSKKAEANTGVNAEELRNTARELMSKIKALFDAGKKEEAQALIAKAKKLFNQANARDKQDNSQFRRPNPQSRRGRNFDKFFAQRAELRKRVTAAAAELAELQATANELTESGKKAEAAKMKARIDAARARLTAITRQVAAAQVEAMYNALADLPRQKYASAELQNARKVLLQRAAAAAKQGKKDVAKKLRASADLLNKNITQFDATKATRQAQSITQSEADLTRQPKPIVGGPLAGKKPASTVQQKKFQEVRRQLSERLNSATTSKRLSGGTGASYFQKKKFAKNQDLFRKRLLEAGQQTKKGGNPLFKSNKTSSGSVATQKNSKVEGRIRHLLAAAENLAAAGFRDQANGLIEQAEQLRKAGKVSEVRRPVKNRQEIDELRGNVKRLSKQVDRLTQLVEKLIENQVKNKK